MVTLVWFRDKKKAKIFCIIMGAIAAAFFLASAALYAVEQYKLSTYYHLAVTVADYDTSNGKDVWTEVQFDRAGVGYVTRIKGHSYWMKTGEQFGALINPANPAEIQPMQSIGTLPRTLLFPGLLFGVFFLVYLANYFLIVRREKKKS
ncbi:MAG: hypothetical protein ACK5L3_01050 [Oscillospiraceae bacterium]